MGKVVLLYKMDVEKLIIPEAKVEVEYKIGDKNDKNQKSKSPLICQK